MNKQTVSLVPTTNLTLTSKDILPELVRKSIHLLIGLTPLLVSALGRPTMMLFLGLGTLGYTCAELLRLHGTSVPLISAITRLAMRPRDKKGFVLGPVTLGLGALLALALYPEPASVVALYALAFGDGLSSLVGRIFGTVKIPYSGGKSLEGFLAGFLGVLISTSLTLPHLSPIQILTISIGASVLELLPTKDFDNIVIPLGTGLLAILVI